MSLYLVWTLKLSQVCKSLSLIPRFSLLDIMKIPDSKSKHFSNFIFASCKTGDKHFIRNIENNKDVKYDIFFKMDCMESIDLLLSFLFFGALSFYHYNKSFWKENIKEQLICFTNNRRKNGHIIGWFKIGVT